MGKAKWVEVDSAQEPIEAVARRTLQARLELVWKRLESAIGPPHKVVEDVHQLRVAVRRAVAAMDIFEPLLPGGRAKWVNKRLRRVRRAAGDARDLDVFGERLLKLASSKPHAEYGLLMCQVDQKRIAAQRPIEKYYKRLKKKFSDRVHELVERVRLRCQMDQLSKPTFAEAARSALRPVVAELFARADADLHDYAALHALRIEAKRLRYVMEIFAAAFDESFRGDLYSQIECMQEKLGEINDHRAACEHLREWFHADEDKDSHVREVIADIMAEEQQAMQRSRERFLEWWTPERRTELERSFAERLNSSSHYRVSESQPSSA